MKMLFLSISLNQEPLPIRKRTRAWIEREISLTSLTSLTGRHDPPATTLKQLTQSCGVSPVCKTQAAAIDPPTPPQQW